MTILFHYQGITASVSHCFRCDPDAVFVSTQGIRGKQYPSRMFGLSTELKTKDKLATVGKHTVSSRSYTDSFESCLPYRDATS